MTYRTQRALAAGLGLNERTIRNWVGRLGFPGGRRGPWDHDAVKEHLDLNRRCRLPGEHGVSELARAKILVETERLAQSARKLMLENDATESNLVLREVVEQEWAIICAKIKGRMEQYPDEVRMEFPPASREYFSELLRAKVNGWLKELDGWSLNAVLRDDGKG